MKMYPCTHGQTISCAICGFYPEPEVKPGPDILHRRECSICGKEVVGQVWNCSHPHTLAAKNNPGNGHVGITPTNVISYLRMPETIRRYEDKF